MAWRFNRKGQQRSRSDFNLSLLANSTKDIIGEFIRLRINAYALSLRYLSDLLLESL